MHKNAGFTLIELLIVISIFALITAGLLPLTSRYATERQLEDAADELLSLIQLQQQNAAYGSSSGDVYLDTEVEVGEEGKVGTLKGSWYGVEIVPTTRTITAFEVTNPDKCDILDQEKALTNTLCNKNQTTFEKGILKSPQTTFLTELVFGSSPPASTTQPIEIRFNRGPGGQQTIVVHDQAQQSPILQRARITLQNGTRKRIIVIDGGNICAQSTINTTPSACENLLVGGQRVVGGPKIGRIFLVENN